MLQARTTSFSDFHMQRYLSSHENDQRRDHFQGRSCCYGHHHGYAIVPNTTIAATDPALLSNPSVIARLARVVCVILPHLLDIRCLYHVSGSRHSRLGDLSIMNEQNVVVYKNVSISILRRHKTTLVCTLCHLLHLIKTTLIFACSTSHGPWHVVIRGLYMKMRLSKVGRHTHAQRLCLLCMRREDKGPRQGRQ